MLIRAAFLTLSVTAALPLASANSVTLGAQLDNTMYAESNTESNGLGDAFFAGVNGLNQVRRGLIQFDVASAIPAGSTITSVQLVLFMSKTNSGVADIELHRCLAQWGEGTSNAPSGEGSGTTATTGDATWGRRIYPSLSWTTPGGDFAAAASSTLPVNQVGTYTWPSTPTLVADVQSFLNSPSTNFGWVLVNTDELSAPTAKRFWTRNYSVANVRPALIVDFTPPGVGSNYCFGDGTGTACPCANSGAIGNGCENSLGAGGGNLVSTGTASVSSDTWLLSSANVPNGPGLFFQGTTKLGGGNGVVFGDGLRCVGGSVVRLGVVVAAGNSSTYPSGATPPNNVPISLKGFAAAGNVLNYQLWYRDSAAFCSASVFNLTNAVNVTWAP